MSAYALCGPAGHREWQVCERHLKDIELQGTENFPFVFIVYLKPGMGHNLSISFK